MSENRTRPWATSSVTRAPTPDLSSSRALPPVNELANSGPPRVAEALRRVVYDGNHSVDVPHGVSGGVDIPQAYRTQNSDPDSFDAWLRRISQTRLTSSATADERRHVHDAQQLYMLRHIHATQLDQRNRIGEARAVIVQVLRSPFMRRFGEMQGISMSLVFDDEGDRQPTIHQRSDPGPSPSGSQDTSMDTGSVTSLDDFLSDGPSAEHSPPSASPAHTGTPAIGVGSSGNAPQPAAAASGIHSVASNDYEDVRTGQKRRRASPGFTPHNPFVLEDD